MHKTVYQRLNFVFYILIMLAGAIFQSTLLTYFPFSWFKPDLMFILAVYFGYQKDLLEGGTLLLIGSWIFQIHSSAGHHYFLVVYLYTFLFAKILSKIFVTQTILTSTFGIGIVLYVFKQLGLLTLLSMNGKYNNAFLHFAAHLIPSLVTQAALIPILFKLFKKLDLNTFSDIHSEDEMDLNKEI